MINEAKSNLEPQDLQADLFKVLTHPVRIAILEILRDGEHCVCHMEAYLGLRQAYLSQQLSVLREAGIIRDRRDGWNIFYQVVDPRIYDVLDAAFKMTGKQKPDIRKAEIACTCPQCTAKMSAD